MVDRKKQLVELIAALEKDAAEPSPRFPAQARQALANEQVVNAIVARFERGQTVVDVRPLPYHPESGLSFVCFAFDPPGMLMAGRESLLVVLHGTSTVVGIVEPFDTRPPSTTVRESTAPFALARPSVTTGLRFPAQDLEPVQARTEAFFQRIGLRGGDGSRINLSDGGTTPTPISTQTSIGHGGWGPGVPVYFEPDYQTDSMTDDAYA